MLLTLATVGLLTTTLLRIYFEEPDTHDNE